MKTYIRSVQLFLIALTTIPTGVWADAPPSDRFEERVPVQQSPQIEKDDMMSSRDEAEWIFTLTPVVNVVFFDDDRDRPIYGGHLDVRRSDFPLNFRVGVEGAHFDSEQASLQRLQAETKPFSSGPELTYLRIPFALELMHDLGSGLELFGGAGYNIIRIDNLASDTGSGFHLSGRLGYNITDNFGASVEGGYLFAEDLDAEGRGDVELSGPFVSSGLYFRY